MGLVCGTIFRGRGRASDFSGRGESVCASGGRVGVHKAMSDIRRLSERSYGAPHAEVTCHEEFLIRMCVELLKEEARLVRLAKDLERAREAWSASSAASAADARSTESEC